MTAQLRSLDGWRAASILLVLAGHMLPLGPKAWRLNEMAGPAGMALFFCLSGFLITRTLLHDCSVGNFFIKRLLRVVPLAWLAMVVGFVLYESPSSSWTVAANLLFFANLPPYHLTNVGGHFWSLCVEMQFYALVGFAVWLAGRRGLLALPVLCLVITLARLIDGEPVPPKVVTWLRLDEILAGATLALAYEGQLGERAKRLFHRASPLWAVALLLVSSHPAAPWANYLRPYVAMALVGSTLGPSYAPWLRKVLESAVATYLAKISFALYVTHAFVMHSPLGTGATQSVLALNRVLAFVATFALAHASTFYYEPRWIAWGRRVIRDRSTKARASKPVRRNSSFQPDEPALSSRF